MGFNSGFKGLNDK